MTLDELLPSRTDVESAHRLVVVGKQNAGGGVQEEGFEGSDGDASEARHVGQGDVIRVLLDSGTGTLTIKKNGTLLGVAATGGLTGNLCWAVACSGDDGSVRIKAVDPAEF